METLGGKAIALSRKPTLPPGTETIVARRKISNSEYQKIIVRMINELKEETQTGV
jgi:hypothetical protein